MCSWSCSRTFQSSRPHSPDQSPFRPTRQNLLCTRPLTTAARTKSLIKQLRQIPQPRPSSYPLLGTLHQAFRSKLKGGFLKKEGPQGRIVGLGFRVRQGIWGDPSSGLMRNSQSSHASAISDERPLPCPSGSNGPKAQVKAYFPNAFGSLSFGL